MSRNPSDRRFSSYFYIDFVHYLNNKIIAGIEPFPSGREGVCAQDSLPSTTLADATVSSVRRHFCLSAIKENERLERGLRASGRTLLVAQAINCLRGFDTL